MNTEVAAPANVFELVKQQQPLFENVNSGDAVTWEKESQFAIQQLQKNDFLAKVAWGNVSSLQNAIINVASIGISLNPANKHAYLVPRDGMVCLDISYMGLLHLAMQSGAIEWGQAKLVYQNDVYVNRGIDKAPKHEQKTFGAKGEVIGAYCTVKLPSGDYLTEEMDIDALHKVRSASKAFTSGKACPWRDYEGEMMRKTVVKRGSKYWPSCENLNTAIHVINEHEGIEEAPPYTEETKNLIDKCLADGNGFSLTALVAPMDEEEETALINSFPKGQISSNKALWRKLNAEGFESWVTFAAEIKTYIENGDSDSLKSDLEGFADFEKRHLSNLLGASYTATLKELLK